MKGISTVTKIKDSQCLYLPIVRLFDAPRVGQSAKLKIPCRWVIFSILLRTINKK